MKIGLGGTAIRQIGHLFEGDSVAGLGEVQLLDRYVRRRDEPAFAALVARHGPMVLGVCRRVLVDPLDVEDAFQATFLVLVRRAGSIRDRDRLAPWLFGVARKVATRARLDRSRRLARERPGAEIDAEAPAVDEHRAELGRALVEEIDRLPGPLRLAVVLCSVEGLSYEEAADRLGSTAPAIRGRLSRARERLRSRLTRRGFAPALGAGSALIAATLSADLASAAVPEGLLMSTTRAAIGFAAGSSATAGAVPATVAILAEGVIGTMMIPKWKIAAMALMAFGLVGSSVGVLGQQPADPLARPSSPDRLDGLEQKLDRLIQVLEAQNRLRETPKAVVPDPKATRDPFGTADVAPVPAPKPAGGPSGGGSGDGLSRKGAMAAPGAGNTGGSARSVTLFNNTNRIDDVEKKLANLEARLSILERAMASLPSREVEIRTLAPGGVEKAEKREIRDLPK